jgi:arylsulfatase A-like enzyme
MEDVMSAPASERPNILFLMTDQHRADHVGFLPGSRFAMPNLDRLADGTAFSNCVTVNPICTPARTALLTGKYTHQIAGLALILFTSDHGEMLGDHQRFQKSTFYRQAVTVPTLVRHPQHLDRRLVTSPTEIIDLTATILDGAGLDWQAELSLPWPAFNNLVPCRSLLPLVRGSATAIRDAAFSECSGQWQMLQTEHCKYVRFLDYPDPDLPRELFFDLDVDPGEQRNAVADSAQAERLGWFRRRREWLLDHTPPAQLRWAPIIGE